MNRSQTRINDVPSRSVLVAIAGCAGTLCSSTALGQTLNWNNAAGGAAATSGNWSPVAVPVAANDLVFNLNNLYPVSWNATVATSRTHSYRRGTITHTFSSPHTTTNGVAIGDLAADVATVTLTTGTWSSGPSGFVNIGDAPNATGTFNINDDDAEFIVLGASDLFIGNNGTGTMSITSGGTVTCNDTIHVGQGSAGIGSLTVSGFVALAPFPISTLTVNGTGQSRWGNGGDATVNISNGARAKFLGDLVIGNLSTSIANVTIQGIGLIVGATVDVAGDLFLGRNTTAGTAAGTATLNVNAPGRVIVDGTTFVAGDPDGGTALLHTGDTSLIQTGSLAIGTGSTLDLDGGAIDINGGVLSWTSTAGSPRFNGGVDNPVITMRQGATSTLSPFLAGPALVVGGGTGANFCDFNVSSGSDLTTTGSVLLGEGPDDFGGMIIANAGSTMVMPSNAILTVGSAGDGRFEAELGGTVTGGRLNIAGGTASVGDVLLENFGTTATFAEVHVGGASGATGGDGLLAVNDEAVFNISNASGPFATVYPIGKIDVAQGATINAPGIHINNQGVIEMEGDSGGLLSTINAFRTQITSGAILRGPTDIAGAGAVNSEIRILSGGLLELTNGNLTAGLATSSLGFDAQNGSIVSVGAHTLTIHDANRATVDAITINGGQIIAPNGLEIVTPGTNGTLDGTGTITTSELFMESGGSVITSTGTNGITINGKFRNNSGMIDGTKYTFNNNPAISDSGWVGAGTINAQVVFNSGTEVFALANITMGNNTAAGVTFNAGSSLIANSNSITLLDSNGLGLPTFTSLGDNLGSGALICAQPLVLNFGRIIQGYGSIQTPAFTVIGTVRPHGANVNTFGRIQATGSINMSTNSDVFFDIYGDDVDTLPYDRINATGAMTISGAAATIHASFAGGFVPTPGTSMTLMTGSTRTGVFPNHDIPQHTKIEYGPNYVALLILCPADFNEDGVVDFFDYLDFVDAFSGNLPTADFNRDSVIDFFDYLDYVDVFSSGC